MVCALVLCVSQCHIREFIKIVKAIIMQSMSHGSPEIQDLDEVPTISRTLWAPNATVVDKIALFCISSATAAIYVLMLAMVHDSVGNKVRPWILYI